MRHKNDQFEEIGKLINNFETEDVIIQSMKLKEILKIFTKNIVDDKTLSDLFDFLNTKALQDDGFITKFVCVLCTRQMEAFTANGKSSRNACIEILQKNFQCADHYKRDDVNKFYNSLKLLGEYFNKARNANGSPINILGQSLLNLLNLELEKELKTLFHLKNDSFSELILTQMALNGNLLKNRHKTEIESMLMNTRKCLIEINSLSSKTKAFLIMTLDLYYSNFNDANLEKSIEKIYEPYLLECANKNISKEIKKSEEPEKVIKVTSKLQQPTTSQKSTVSSERRYERQPSVAKTVPVKPIRPPLRKSEPVQHSNSYNSNNIHQQTQRSHSVPQTIQHKSPQKKISPKELRTRTNSNNKTSPRNDKVSSSNISPRALHRVESAIDKLQIKSSNDIKQTSNTSEPVPQSANDENLILKQQNSNGNSAVKSSKNSGTSKVYFKEENVENLSWNGETSFEDPENPADPTSPNQYSSSFLNFLSNN
ncbi:unnamed protein product [Chironomus riparius]|uniref:Uncharacterized protein n=1 Tax=Chironomus riparius TaxID=315576 RepID=A0A9N9RQ07_9DIPT|nr:unnamed protein product [Chironomus riparius]